MKMNSWKVVDWGSEIRKKNWRRRTW